MQDSLVGARTTRALENTDLLTTEPINLAGALNREPSRTSSASTGVYERLRLAIVTGELRPNTPLIEVDLAEALKVSRTPVRESLQRLMADGLIVPRRRGWAVREYSQSEIQENYELRAALEGYAAGLAAVRGTEAEISKIAALQAVRDAQVDPSHEFRVNTNRQFHDAIIAAARNARLADEIFRAGQFYFNERIASASTQNDIKANQDDHGKIVRALQSRNTREAEDAMRAHILRTFKAFQRVGGKPG